MPTRFPETAAKKKPRMIMITAATTAPIDDLGEEEVECDHGAENDGKAEEEQCLRR